MVHMALTTRCTSALSSLPDLEKLIEGLKSPDTSLLLPDLLPMTDPFGSTSDAVIGNVIFVSSVMHDKSVHFRLINSWFTDF